MRIAGATRIAVSSVAAAAFLVPAAVGVVLEALFGVHALARPVAVALALVAAAALPLSILAGSAWSTMVSDLQGHLSELEDRRLAEEALQRESDERKRRIRAVIDAGERIDMAYQPVVELGSGRLIGYEALCRFDGGPGTQEVFSLAHGVGLGLELELMAVSRALEPVGDVPNLAINGSPGTLASDEFHHLLEGCAAPDRVVVELTEHVVVDDYAVIARSVERLRGLGIRLAVDDAGSGYASLRHIIDLRPDIIKIDRSLVAAMDSDSARRAVAASLVGLADGMGAELVAEGIETDEELEACLAVGIRLGQGYLLGRPAPLAGAGRD